MVVSENGPDGAIDYGYGLALMESSSVAFNYFYAVDDLGSVSNLTDITGTVREAYSYDAWGNALTGSGNVGTKNKFQFTGQALEPGTGLYFLRARYYDPTVGRFLSKDPLPGFVKQPLTLNRYVYALNNPVKFVDPRGKQAAVIVPAVVDIALRVINYCGSEPACAEVVTAILEKIANQTTGLPPGDFTESALFLLDHLGEVGGLGALDAEIQSGLPTTQPNSECVQSAPALSLPALPPLPPDLLYNPKYLPPVYSGPSIGPR